MFVGVGAILAYALSARLWRADLAVPFRYENDAEGTLMLVKSIIDHGWVQSNPSLGAPNGQFFYDFPLGGDNLNFALMWFLARFSDSPAVVTNLFFLLTFGLVAISAWFVLERLGVVRAVAVAGAILYALTPFHLSRGESHLLLAAYFMLPIAFYLGLRLYKGDLGGSTDRRSTVLSWIGLVATCAVLASTGAYFAVFSVFLILLLGSIGLFRHRRFRSQGTRLAVCLAVIFCVSAANQIQSLTYRASHGLNRDVSVRQAAESEAYALKLAGLLAPTPNNPVEPLADARSEYVAEQLSPGASTEPLGSAAAIGFLFLLIAVPSLAIIGRAPASRSWLPYEMGPLALAALATFLLATVGGFSSLWAVFVSPQIRAWDRAVLVLAFLGIASLSLLVTALVRRLSVRFPARLVSGGIAAVLLVGGLLDQATPAYVPGYANTAAEFGADRAFVHSVIDRVGEHAVLLQLPYHGFPETGPLAPGVGDYAQVRGYLHAPGSVRWSFGAMRGRPADIVRTMAALPVPEMLSSAVAGGFTDLWIDRRAYAASGGPATEAALAAIVGAPLLSSPDARYAIYGLGPVRSTLEEQPAPAAQGALHDAVFRPTLVNAVGINPDQTTPGTLLATGAPQVDFMVQNPTSNPRVLSIQGQPPGRTRPGIVATVIGSSQSKPALRARFGVTHVEVLVPPGGSTIRLTAQGLGSRPGNVELTRLSIVDNAIRRFAARLGES